MGAAKAVDRIRKHVVLIVSAGRTGTAFLGERMSEFVSDCWSAHEPDVWDGWLSRHSWRAVRWFGPYHTIVGKLIRRTGMRAIAERYLSGDWSGERAATAIIRQRRRFYETRPASLVVESNYQWYGVLPLLRDVFARYGVLAIVRDPRTWVRSRINFGAHHDRRDRVQRLGLPRVSPGLLGREGGAAEWDRMDTFQRLCWDWNFVAERLIQAAAADPAVRLARFEDLFLAGDRRETMLRVLEDVTGLEATDHAVEIPPEALAARTNTSSPRRTRGWEEWTAAQRTHLLETCGEAMTRLGYEA
jgi:hypothetical protein